MLYNIHEPSCCGYHVTVLYFLLYSSSFFRQSIKRMRDQMCLRPTASHRITPLPTSGSSPSTPRARVLLNWSEAQILSAVISPLTWWLSIWSTTKSTRRPCPSTTWCVWLLLQLYNIITWDYKQEIFLWSSGFNYLDFYE